MERDGGNGRGEEETEVGKAGEGIGRMVLNRNEGVKQLGVGCLKGGANDKGATPHKRRHRMMRHFRPPPQGFLHDLRQAPHQCPVHLGWSCFPAHGHGDDHRHAQQSMLRLRWKMGFKFRGQGD